nr:immunoglobulin heavy chain junction region [Macaca mulatta]
CARQQGYGNIGPEYLDFW